MAHGQAYDELLAEAKLSPSVKIGSEWMQGRACFGGLVTGLLFSEMKTKVDAEALPRSLQISFVGPVAGGPDAPNLELSAEVLREGKNVSHVLGRGEQNGTSLLVMQASFGKPRVSSVSVAAAPMVPPMSVSETNKLPYIEGVLPAFTQNFDFRYCTPFPFAGSEERYLKGWVKFETAPDRIEAEHVLALVDAWPPATLPILKSPAMASSLSWTIEFAQPQPNIDPSEYVYYEAEIVESSHGYGHTKAMIYTQSGELIAISQQTVTHFA